MSPLNYCSPRNIHYFLVSLCQIPKRVNWSVDYLIRVLCLKLRGVLIRPNISVWIRQHFLSGIAIKNVSKISRKGDKLKKYPQIFQYFFPVHSNLYPKSFPSFLNKLVRFLRFNAFGFSGLFPRQFPTPYLHLLTSFLVWIRPSAWDSLSSS